MPYNGIQWHEKEVQDRLISLLQSGMSYQEVGSVFGITRQRIKQVIQKLKLDVTTIGKKVEVSKKKEERRVNYLKKWGERVNTDLYRVKRAKFRNKKSQVLRAGKEWTLNFGDIIWPTHCPVLGIELDYFLEKTGENSPSFDRTDSSKGYIVGNVQVISWRANRIKNDGNADEHRKIAEYLYKLK